MYMPTKCRNTRRLEGKVAFITGAARGQGRSHAIRLAEEGADIIAVDLCDEVPSTSHLYRGATHEDLTETVRAVRASGRRVVPATVDVRDFEALQRTLEDGTAELGRVDIIAANAGVFHFGEQAHVVSESAWKDVIDINLTGVWHTCKAAIPSMIEQGIGGSITLTSSTAGLKGIVNAAPYSASKHGLVGLMRTLALELAPHRIRVNTIHPTSVATDMILNEAMFKLFLPDVAMPTQQEASVVFQTINALPIPWIEPIDVSNALVFLASDDARYITGSELKVDAGFTIK
jgi:SDR family mycofactocin-dependent oxidoreductase